MAEMDPQAGASQRRAFPRVPLRAKVRMEFAEQRCFLSEWAVNLSPGGMFVRSEAPMAAGQRFHFDAGLTPKGPRFEGVGEVIWVRSVWEGSARPPGFAVRFLEVQQDGIDVMQRLAEVFLDRGVAAMQEELHALSLAWQRRHSEDETVDEPPTLEGPEEPLADTAVIAAPWVTAELPTDIAGAASAAGAAEAAADGEQAAAAADETLPAPPAKAVAGEPPAAAKPVPRRRVWWVGGLALLLAGSYVLLDGPLGRARSAAPTAELPRLAAAVPVAARGLAGATAFRGLDDVSWSEDAQGLWVVLALDGALPPGALRRLRFEEDHPREVIQLLGARRGFTPALLPVGSPLLDRIRVGFHPAMATPGLAGDELRVVLDLPSAGVVVRSVLADGRSLRVLLVREVGVDPLPADTATTPPAAVTAAAPG